MNDSGNLPKVYDPQQVEKKWYSWWEEEGFFTPQIDPEKRPFSIVMPPPNVTGQLHLGHAIDNTMQDILTRFRRMQGFATLWLPGTDHAGIATQAKVEEKLREEGLTRHDLGREQFLERVWDWKHTYHDRITSQLRSLGSSCDWSRERFTMDEGCSKAVREVFVSLYEQGLIYQGDYIVNWCPQCHTTISDIEVEHEEEPGNLWHIRYPVEGEDEYVIVATTRPETMLGDTGVAVHPDDPRYKELVGKYVVLPLVGRRIPIFADSYVDMEFGTGAVKVTPAHDPNDFEMGRRHNLESVTVIKLDGTMSDSAGEYAGLDRYECRKRVVEDLKQQGYLVKVEEHAHSVGHCYRCNSIIEPLVSRQWFVRMKPLAEPAIEKVINGETTFVPQRFTRVYLNWMENIRDWCISRQLWWGHRIPVWYCDNCGHVICSREDPTSCPECGSKDLHQDEDVLDTWFSSALWPFSTLGWPEKTEDLSYFYPTSLLVTGRDIIFFWVARMIFSGIHHTGVTPFKDVLIHGLILDEKGRKMSKSLGNGVDPIEVIENYGADTLRFSLVTGTTAGNDIRFHWEKVENTRNFANKIWNASRFVLMNLGDHSTIEIGDEDYEIADRWILTRLAEVIEKVTHGLDEYELGEAAREIYDFIWDEFCDWYIELAKPRLYRPKDFRQNQVVKKVLVKVLKDTMKLLHPFMPFITEEIYQQLPDIDKSIMISRWPEVDTRQVWPDAVTEMREVMDTIRAIRNLRAEWSVPPGARVNVILLAANQGARERLERNREYIVNLAHLEGLSLKLSGEGEAPARALSAHLGSVDVFMPVEGLVDTEKERARLAKELDGLEQEESRICAKLANEKFLAKAPADVVEKEKERLAEVLRKREGVLKRIEILS